ncbi:MAG: hypothetical protein QOE16_2751 [Microbacteriaceae bacterium]|jgi:hypothetical protein|nr:hypothetical protein [Microbacteriaceae bacterium]
MKTSTRLIITGAASILGVALAAGGAYAATGITDAPGQALKLSGVGPAASKASSQALSTANSAAKGLYGDATATPTPTATADASATATAAATPGHAAASAQGVASSTNTAAPVAPSIASKQASTVKGDLTGKEISAWAQSTVQTVAPNAAVTVGAGLTAGASTK